MKKKISMLMALVVVALMSMTFISCDDDDSDVAYTLAGTWEGNMQVYYQYGGVTYEATYSQICFSQDPYSYSSGRGYWIDYYNRGGWGSDYIANHINWTVSNGNIYVHFIEEGTDIVITNYGLDDNYFDGEIVMDGVYTRFSLTHTSSPNWSNFHYGYDFNYYYGYGYAKPNGKFAPKEKPRRFIGKPNN